MYLLEQRLSNVWFFFPQAMTPWSPPPFQVHGIYLQIIIFWELIALGLFFILKEKKIKTRLAYVDFHMTLQRFPGIKWPEAGLEKCEIISWRILKMKFILYESFLKISYTAAPILFYYNRKMKCYTCYKRVCGRIMPWDNCNKTRNGKAGGRLTRHHSSAMLTNGLSANLTLWM